MKLKLGSWVFPQLEQDKILNHWVTKMLIVCDAFTSTMFFRAIYPKKFQTKKCHIMKFQLYLCVEETYSDLCQF